MKYEGMRQLLAANVAASECQRESSKADSLMTSVASAQHADAAQEREDLLWPFPLPRCPPSPISQLSSM